MSLTDRIAAIPTGVTFGVATASYQIEGSSFGGCGPSHWDDFAAEEGRVFQGHNGSVACDHYHHYAADLDLIAEAGFDAYRFSFSWPRLLPETNQSINPEGISFYDRLIDEMLARNIRPFATLYHWDLPRRHAMRGGWQNRDTAQYFADYTELVLRHFGDRLESVAPVNEPWCVSFLSHYWGHHAPGLADLSATAKAMHYIQLAHGLSIQVMREAGQDNLGCVLNKEYFAPSDDSALAQEKTHLFDGIYNRWFEDSLFKGCYPEEVVSVFGEHMPENYHDDMAVIASPLDWVGVNYYTRSVIVPDKTEPHLGFKCVRGALPKTDMDWEVVPEGLGFFLRRLAKDYCTDIPIYITENGMAAADKLREDTISDTDRIAYFEGHLDAVARAIEDGVPVKGYFAWSLLDNYEWAFGYDKRFGIVHVDFDSLKRTPKQSYHEWQKGLLSRRS